MEDHNQKINLDDINIDDIMKNNQLTKNDSPVQSSPVQSSPVQSSPEDNIDLPHFDEDYFQDEQNEPEELGITIDDSALREKEDWFQSETRNVENLKVECHALYKDCYQKKQEIQAIKNNIAFSHDCKNDIEIIYTSIETDTCENIKAHATDIGKNIRTNKNIAEMYLRNLKRDTELLTLQFDYINIIEKFSITCSEWNKRQKIVEEVRVKISDFDAIRERMRQRALSDQEDRRKIMEIQEIIHQR
jgi:hypothetical protein